MSRVEISDGGRAGTITYREGLHTASFSWEFAISPALAMLNGPSARDWDRLYPWAFRRKAAFEALCRNVGMTLDPS